MRKLLWVGLVTFLFTASCASAEPMPARQQYIRAHPHGWLEIEVLDTSIPDIRVASDTGEVSYQRPSCRLFVSLNSEPVVEETLYPPRRCATVHAHHRLSRASASGHPRCTSLLLRLS